ncbi:MAG: AAA family ATPase [Proteobacteria bacterium]|nr:AAA family ATPase [Pseudomonadota bacterium]
MNVTDEKIPRPEEVEKELNEFLSTRFGNRVRVAALSQAQDADEDGERTDPPPRPAPGMDFSMKPEELSAYLDQYIVRQDRAKAVLATKICTHYNRVKLARDTGDDGPELVGGVKNNVLLMGPTGVGKTYMLKLIARRLGVPFVKGDATKFSETGYVGGDVEDLVRDLAREADGDLERAQCGIIYIDEIDKIASSAGHHGADVSRTGVQRALLKPMEETEVDLKVPHDPVSMIQELERFRKSGKKESSKINTKNILFIMSGAFSDLAKIIKKRVADQGIGFSASVGGQHADLSLLQQVRSEDLVAYGFESEFVGRLPVTAVLDELSPQDLYEILKNPNNPIILGKKLDFAAYGIDVRFEDAALRLLAEEAALEKTGARGLVSALERAVLPFEKRLPSTAITRFAVTGAAVADPEGVLAELTASPAHPQWSEAFGRVAATEKEWIREYLRQNQAMLSERFDMKLTASRVDLAADLYGQRPTDVRSVMKRIHKASGMVRKIELRFFQDTQVNVVLEEDAVDHVVRITGDSAKALEDYYGRFVRDFEYGLKLLKEKTGGNRFFITREALCHPEAFLNDLVKKSLAGK